MPADGLEVGDRVNVDTCEGFGGEGVIVAERDSDTCRFKVRLDGGKGEPFWAHDFELSPLGPPKEGYDSRPDTRKHIGEVRRLLSKVVDDFVRRQREHDASKLVSPEVEAFDEFTPKLRDSTYGSPEYEGFRKAMGEALAHHYAHNSHHPEHYPDGVRGMNLFDVLEMLCDWLAATKRYADGDIRKSVEINQKRFGYGDELKRILLNTLPLLEG
jgi:hypothetical protein